jgi:hypothetical protein
MGNKGSCKAEGCEKDVRGKGYCDGHYRKWRKGLLGKPRHRSCHEKGCGKPRSRRGLCEVHFAQKTMTSVAVAPAAEATT